MGGAHATAQMWQSMEPVFSFHCVGPGDLNLGCQAWWLYFIHGAIFLLRMEESCYVVWARDLPDQGSQVVTSLGILLNVGCLSGTREDRALYSLVL